MFLQELQEWIAKRPRIPVALAAFSFRLASIFRL